MFYWHLKQELSLTLTNFFLKSDYTYILEVNIWGIILKNLNGILLVFMLFIMKLISGMEN